MMLSRIAASAVARRHLSQPRVVEMRGFAKLRLRQRSGDMHMLYMASFVGVGSGFYIFKPLFQEYQDSLDDSDDDSETGAPPSSAAPSVVASSR
jgi:hypothetical protein